jgi:hypothetical protein
MSGSRSSTRLTASPNRRLDTISQQQRNIQQIKPAKRNLKPDHNPVYGHSLLRVMMLLMAATGLLPVQSFRFFSQLTDQSSAKAGYLLVGYPSNWNEPIQPRHDPAN